MSAMSTVAAIAASEPKAKSSTNIRKGSLVKINQHGTGIFARFIGMTYKVEEIVTLKTAKYVRIAGTLIHMHAVDYQGPQGKKGSTCPRVKSR